MDQDVAVPAVFGIIGVIFLFVYFAVILFVIIGMWKAFTKAGHPGIACIVPIWNMIVFVQIAGKPIWWVLLMFIPLVGFVIAILLNLAIAKSFGKSEMFGVGLVFLPFIFWPILGFGDSRYLGVKA